MTPARFITDFADQAVLLPLAAVIGIGLWAAGWRRGAVAWVAVIGGMLVVMLALKLWAGACGEIYFGDQMQSPSGHTASAAAIYGGVLSLLAHRALRGTPMTLVCAGVLALMVGASRVVIGAHSVMEVAVGAFVGVLAALILERAAGPAPRRIRIMPMLATMLVTIVVFHGLHLPAEAAIRRVKFTWMPFGVCRSVGGNQQQRVQKAELWRPNVVDMTQSAREIFDGTLSITVVSRRADSDHHSSGTFLALNDSPALAGLSALLTSNFSSRI